MPCTTSTKIEPDSRGLVPAIYVFVPTERKQDVDARDERGHDEERSDARNERKDKPHWPKVIVPRRNASARIAPNKNNTAVRRGEDVCVSEHGRAGRCLAPQ